MYMNVKQINISGLLLVVVALSVGFYVQYGLGLQPCPLCVIQRICMSIVGFLFLASTIQYQNKTWSSRYLMVGLFIVSIGLLAVGRQLYLQSLPQTDGTLCLPAMSFFWQTGAYFKAMKSLFVGTAECGAVIWKFMGLSLAAWSAIFLSGLFAMIVAALVKLRGE